MILGTNLLCWWKQRIPLSRELFKLSSTRMSKNLKTEISLLWALWGCRLSAFLADLCLHRSIPTLFKVTLIFRCRYVWHASIWRRSAVNYCTSLADTSCRITSTCGAPKWQYSLMKQEPMRPEDIYSSSVLFRLLFSQHISSASRFFRLTDSSNMGCY